MEMVQVILLALIQGLTEFLPISSSAHLILPQEILGWPIQGLAFTVAVHVGSLLAVILYFRQEMSKIAVSGIKSLGGHWSDDAKLAWFLVLGTVPAGLAGLLFEDFIESHLQTSQVIAYATLLGALLLYGADRYSKGKLEINDLTWKFVLIIGIAQATALIPGTSRSGITMTAALLLGLNATSAAKFSFLLSIPVITLSGGWKAIQLADNANTDWFTIGVAIFVSGLSSYFCIHFFLKLIQKLGFTPFILYRLVLGILLLAFF